MNSVTHWAFQGIGCVLVSEVATVTAVAGPPAPARLVVALQGILEIQHQAILRQCGVIEQFVGDSTIAYWRPADPAQLAVRAFTAAQEIVGTRIKTPELQGALRAAFCVGECAGAFFGRGSAKRFQVIGRARDRTGRLLRESLVMRTGIACDAEAFALLPEAARATLTPDRAGNYATPS